jgi:hypothetical protein
MTRSRFLLCLMLLVFGGGMARAADGSPEAFLTAIYKHYPGKVGQTGLPLNSDADIRRYFEPSLATLMIADRKAAATRDEPPTLDGDPFVGAQEWEIKDLHVSVAEAGADRAVGTVAYKSFDAPVTITVDLVRTAHGWRIGDVHWPDGTLRGLLTAK